jgi:hypothetical protein
MNLICKSLEAHHLHYDHEICTTLHMISKISFKILIQEFFHYFELQVIVETLNSILCSLSARFTLI